MQSYESIDSQREKNFKATAIAIYQLAKQNYLKAHPEYPIDDKTQEAIVKSLEDELAKNEQDEYLYALHQHLVDTLSNEGKSTDIQSTFSEEIINQYKKHQEQEDFQQSFYKQPLFTVKKNGSIIINDQAAVDIYQKVSKGFEAKQKRLLDAIEQTEEYQAFKEAEKKEAEKTKTLEDSAKNRQPAENRQKAYYLMVEHIDTRLGTTYLKDLKNINNRDNFLKELREILSQQIAPYKNNLDQLDAINEAFSAWLLESNNTSSDDVSNCQVIREIVMAHVIPDIQINRVIDDYNKAFAFGIKKEESYSEIKKNWNQYEVTLGSMTDDKSMALIQRLHKDYRAAYKEIVMCIEKYEEAVKKLIKTIDEKHENYPLLLEQQKVIKEQKSYLAIENYNSNYKNSNPINRTALLEEIGFFQRNLSFSHLQLTKTRKFDWGDKSVEMTGLQILGNNTGILNRMVTTIRNALAKVLQKDSLDSSISTLGFWQKQQGKFDTLTKKIPKKLKFELEPEPEPEVPSNKM